MIIISPFVYDQCFRQKEAIGNGTWRRMGKYEDVLKQKTFKIGNILSILILKCTPQNNLTIDT